MEIECRGCGVCCTEISISTPFNGHADGKPAGVPCTHLQGSLCGLFNQPERPEICISFQANTDICGTNAEEAQQIIRWYERATAP